jgi:hypothetical protein
MVTSTFVAHAAQATPVPVPPIPRHASVGTPDPAGLADQAVRAVLRTQWDGIAAVRLDSPPGAGKTGVVERLAVQAMSLLRERCMVVTQTNEQAFDVGRRLARNYPGLPFGLFVTRELAVPADLLTLPNLHVARTSLELPPGPCVVVANAHRWSWMDDLLAEPFDCQIVDEAFQLPDHVFHQIAGMARRVVLVGDPGQIAPVVTCETERWRCDPAGPHVACPNALAARHPEVLRLALPVSRRLVPDTVRIVQPAFYPDLPFRAMSRSGARGLRATRPSAGTSAASLDDAMALAERGASIVAVELPALVTGEVDEFLSAAIVDLAARLLERGTVVRDDRDYEGAAEQPLTAGMIGVVCAHVSQVNAVRERLPRALSDVFVETANRFQGLERPIMLVHHPLSGRADANEFHLDAGRLCVMLSRHRIACFVVSRAGVEDMLLRYAPNGDRILGLERDEEFEGWRAHLSVLQAVRREGRVVRISLQ